MRSWRAIKRRKRVPEFILIGEDVKIMRNWWHIEQRDAREPLLAWKDIDLLITDTPAVETLEISQIEYAMNQWAKRMSPTGIMIVCVNDPINIDFANVATPSHQDYADGSGGRKAFTERLIVEHSKHYDIVADPFCGTSTTGECALRLGRNYIGTDIAKGPIETSFEQLLKLTVQE